MSGRRAKPTLAPDQLTIAWQSVSLLLDYPDEELVARTDLIRSASRGLPPGIGDPIRTFLEHLQSHPEALRPRLGPEASEDGRDRSDVAVP